VRVALIGSRGIPARYGGFETLMENLASRLSRQGMEVTVYCRERYTPPQAEGPAGVELVVLPTLRTKHLETPVHTLLSCIHALGRGFDAALVVNSANVFFVPLLQAAGVGVALNVDGLEWRRAKWGLFGRWVYRLAELLSCGLPDALITDALNIQRHYRERYGVDSHFIPYGVDPQPLAVGPCLRELSLTSRRYFLFVGRFEPENNPHRIVEAYGKVGGNLPLVMVGDAPYPTPEMQAMRATADPRVLFPGGVYGEGYRELLSHALAVVQAKEVGGSHPALVEALGYGVCPVVHDTPENREVAGDVGLYFDIRDPVSLIRRMEWVREHPAETAERGCRAAARAVERFSWERIAASYASLLLAVAGRSQKSRGVTGC
jgi:glycosyltransferase involved in cell wall biosynthesis